MSSQLLRKAIMQSDAAKKQIRKNIFLSQQANEPQSNLRSLESQYLQVAKLVKDRSVVRLFQWCLHFVGDVDINRSHRQGSIVCVLWLLGHSETSLIECFNLVPSYKLRVQLCNPSKKVGVRYCNKWVIF